MSGYLDNFGVVDAKREKRNKRIIVSILSIAVVSGLLWFFFRDWKEEARVREFIALLEKKDFRQAYALWGCTDATPCRDYAFDKFLRDWGPDSIAGNMSAVQRGKVKSCSGGIIQQMTIKGEEVNLFVDRNSLVLGFSPWPVCAPRIAT